MNDCCKECFVPSKDGDYILPSGHSVVTAYPEGCKDEDCPCHSQDTQWGNYGTPERLQLRSLMEAWKKNPSNGNRHEEAIVDFISSLLASERTRLATAVEGHIEKIGLLPHFPGGATERRKRDQLEALQEVLDLIRHSPNK